jgi:enamine deaminase RidA (YjgF/YER057c/UK114 family)
MPFLVRSSMKGDMVAFMQRINPPGLARPSGFSHAVSVGAAGRLVFLAGQAGLDAEGRVVPGGVVAQFVRALGNLLTVLAAAGGQAADLVTMTIYVVNIDDYRAHAKEIGAAWRRLAGSEYPAMAAVEVTRLWDPAAAVEIQGVAALSAR